MAIMVVAILEQDSYLFCILDKDTLITYIIHYSVLHFLSQSDFSEVSWSYVVHFIY